jgi:hypothetical protein
MVNEYFILIYDRFVILLFLLPIFMASLILYPFEAILNLSREYHSFLTNLIFEFFIKYRKFINHLFISFGEFLLYSSVSHFFIH